MSAASSRMLGEVVLGDAAPTPSQAALDLKEARDAFDDALSRWAEFTPRELGERAERLWVCLKVLRDSVTT